MIRALRLSLLLLSLGLVVARHVDPAEAAHVAARATELLRSVGL